MPDYFPQGSLIRRINAEPAIGFLAGRALLLQLAHPAVAQGVADHSDFQRNPFKRLQGTLEAMYAIVFGSTELATGVGRRIHRIHEFITGPSYEANVPENLLWVHATLMDSALLAYTTFVGRLTAEEQETYYQEMKRVAEPFGLERRNQPPTLADFRAYFDDAVRTLEVTDVGRDLIGYIVRPSLPARLHIPLAPALALHRLITVGTTPAPLRDRVGFSWDPKRQQRLDRWTRFLRRLFAIQPRAVRTAPTWLGGRVLLWQAARHVRQFDAKGVRGAAASPGRG
ncbi:MAG: oxygenase MpaB family protein [Acidimicrobiales bacterium]